MSIVIHVGQVDGNGQPRKKKGVGGNVGRGSRKKWKRWGERTEKRREEEKEGKEGLVRGTPCSTGLIDNFLIFGYLLYEYRVDQSITGLR